MSYKSADAKMMDLLARRGHTELELRRKLSLNYDEFDIDSAIERAKQQGWLAPPGEATERVVEELTRKRKGHRYITQFLEQKGLPPVAEDPEAEFEKARELLAQRLNHDFDEGPLPEELVEKAQRILFNRGFNGETISRVLAR